MSGNESHDSANMSENSSGKSMSDDNETSTLGSDRSSHVVDVGSYAYDDEPLAEPGENVNTPDDADGILPVSLEQ